MERYLFILGRKNEIAFYELKTVFKSQYKQSNFELQKFDSYAILQINQKFNAQQLIYKLGGTVKIIKLRKPSNAKDLIDNFLNILRNECIGKSKLVFGLSFINSPEQNLRFTLPKELKKFLAKEGINTRYVMPRKSNQLTSAQVELVNLQEFYLLWKDNQIEIGKTLAVQDFKGFAKRDYQRPFITPKEGMLPPKVARMMVNLATCKSSVKKTWLLDPFCGTGTIAMEAMMLGINSISSDIAEEKVSGTKRNLKWLSIQEKNRSLYKVIKSDATKVSNILPQLVDCIVTEPYLGPPTISENKIRGLIKGLNKLYIGAIKDWRKCLHPEGRVVIALPQVSYENKTKTAKLIIDMRENLGYTLVAGPLEYEREKAKVTRQIYILKKK